tara:strand:+ start:1664 stop:2383 length:720 start_codon:yes stop_codon:yes gene_type:complete
MTSDVSDMIWPLFGTAVHHVLETASSDDDVTIEERLFETVNDWVLSGAIDHQRTDGDAIRISDYKVTSVWSVIHGKIEWEYQLNCYAYLVEKAKKMPVKSLQVVAILRDWNRREAGRRPDYPQAPVMTIDVPLWPKAKRRRYVSDRVALHQEAQLAFDLDAELPLCSDEDRWKRGEAWAVKKKGNKRAQRVFDNEASAQEFIGDQENLEIEHREGEYVRCNGNYCGVATFCSQYTGDQK